MPLWTWREIPNTQLSSIEPVPRPLGATGPRSKIDTWCGATLKREGSVYMLGAAGGHNDYAGNEVNAITLNTANPRWVQLRAPSTNADIINEPAQFYLDLRPSSTHTYYATQFIHRLNRMVVIASPGVSGSFPAAPSGFQFTGSSRSFVFNLTTNEWEHPNSFAQFPGNGDFTAALVARHPLTDDIYYSRNYSDGWYRWNAANNTWSKLSNVSRQPWYAGSAIDPVRNRLLIVGGYAAGNPPEVRALDGSPVAASFGGLGASSLTFGGYPGVVFDEVNDDFLVFRSVPGAGLGTTEVLRVDAQTWAVDRPALGGMPPEGRMNGIQNSVQYVPELRGVVFANQYAGNLKFLRTAP